tara:strand:+ start:142 stop:873 length:732 start_codon:yes stop_codon:yes gene_type:complete
MLALAACSTDPDLDSDGDGLTDVIEAELGTDPTLADTDADGYTDSQERHAGTDALDPASLIYAGGWPYNINKDSIADPGWDQETSEGLLVPRFRALDQFGDEVDLYDFAGQGVPIVLDLGTWFCDPCKSLAAWLSDGDTSELDELGWWNDDFVALREKVNSGELYWLTVLFSQGTPVSQQDASDWDDEWPNEHIPVLADTELQLQGYLDVTAMPHISVVEPDMTLTIWGQGPQPGLRHLVNSF